MMFSTSPHYLAGSERPDDHGGNQPPILAGFVGAAWQRVAAITVVLAVCFTQIMFLRTMIERF